MSSQSVSSGINGFGRFGQHLLRYWAYNSGKTTFTIDFINDEGLSIDKALKLLEDDPDLELTIHKVNSDYFTVRLLDGSVRSIRFTTQPLNEISWQGQPDLFFECSGKYADYDGWGRVINHATKRVLLSCSSSTVDTIAIYGFNHSALTTSDRIISYGSCTINAYVPLAKYINSHLGGVIDSDVSVIHNVPAYLLNMNQEPKKKVCTLEKYGPQLLDFLTASNFAVNYYTIPYTGVSIIDFRFRVSKPYKTSDVIYKLEEAFSSKGELSHLYAFTDEGKKPSAHKFSPFSAVLIREQVRFIGDNLYISAYFDNENSVNRYFDLANYISQELG